MKFKHILAIVLINLFASVVIAQKKTNIDSLLQVYREMPNDTTKASFITKIVIHYYRTRNWPELKKYAKQQYDLSKEIDFQKGIANSWRYYGMYHTYTDTTGKYDSAKFYHTKALKKSEEIGYLKGQAHNRSDLASITSWVDGYDAVLKVILDNIEFYKRVKDSNYIARSYHQEARAHNRYGNFRLALDRHLKAVRYFEKEKDTGMTRAIFAVLCDIEIELGHFDKALEYSNKGYYYTDKKNKNHLSDHYNDLGLIYAHQGNFRKADSIFNIAYKLASEADWPYMQRLVSYQHGESYELRDDYESALKKAKHYMALEKNDPNAERSSIGVMMMGRALVKLDRAKKAKGYLDEALTLAEKENMKTRLISIYKTRAEANAKLNNFKEAYRDHEMFAMLRDSVYNKTKSQQIEEMRAIYDTEKKEQQIAQQEIEIDLLEQQEKVSSLQKMLLGGGLGLSLLALGFGFYGFRQRIKRNKLEKEKIEAELAFKKKELTTHALHLAKKNEVLEQVKQKAKELKSADNIEKGYRQLVQTITFDQQDDKAWENFTQYFEAVHKDFAKQIVEKYPEISKNELRLMALIKMNMSSKEIANILNISSDGVKKARQRLRKKMNLSPEDSLETTVMGI